MPAEPTPPTQEQPPRMSASRLLKPLPPGRTVEQVRNHFLVERAIARRLKDATREERKAIYATMYDELFERVPDHPRLTQRRDDRLTGIANRKKLALVREFLTPKSVFLEFAPGDCRFAMEVAAHVRTALAVDISDQRDPEARAPENFRLIVYDGYRLESVEDGSVDLVFSDQFIEHLHPEDTRTHFELAHRLLRPGGRYVFRMPHAMSGPHDVSEYFSEEPEGFHLKEWTYLELRGLLRDLRFRRFYVVWLANGVRLRPPYSYVETCERVLRTLPRGLRRPLASYLVPTICVVAVK